MDDLISRQAVLRCIKESRDDIDWGQSEDGDAFLHYSAALYRTVASKECVPATDVVPVVRCDDCVYYGSRRWCELHSSVFDDNAFCSYGERKE